MYVYIGREVNPYRGDTISRQKSVIVLRLPGGQNIYSSALTTSWLSPDFLDHMIGSHDLRNWEEYQYCMAGR